LSPSGVSSQELAPFLNGVYLYLIDTPQLAAGSFIWIRHVQEGEKR